MPIQAGERRLKEYSADGLRILYSANSGYNAISSAGVFWNADASATAPNIPALRSISGDSTHIGISTETPFISRIGGFTVNHSFGYNETIGGSTPWERSYYTNTSSVLVLRGFRANEVVNLIIGGMPSQASGREGRFSLPDHGLAHEGNLTNSASNIGPVLFKDLIPLDGTIRIKTEMIVSFAYLSFIDILVRNR